MQKNYPVKSNVATTPSKLLNLFCNKEQDHLFVLKRASLNFSFITIKLQLINKPAMTTSVSEIGKLSIVEKAEVYKMLAEDAKILDYIYSQIAPGIELIKRLQ